MKKIATIMSLAALLAMTAMIVMTVDKTPSTPFCEELSAGKALPDVDYDKYRGVVSEIVSAMTLEQKIGQITLADMQSIIDENTEKIDFSLIGKYQVGAIYVGGNEIPDGKGGLIDKGKTCGYLQEDLLFATRENWREYAAKSNIPVEVKLQDGSKISIPPLIGTDTPHGNQHVLGAVLFPQNIGMAATHDPKLMCAAGYFTAADVMDSGFNWGFSPTLAVSHNPKWGRFYESMGDNPSFIMQMAFNNIAGMQMTDPSSGKISGILSTPKHYLGDGATFDGIDEGDVPLTTESAANNFFQVNASGYIGAIEASAGSIMISYNAVASDWMSVNSQYLSKLFDGSLGKPFGGFLVSDQAAINKIATQGLPTVPKKMSYDDALSKSIMDGMDMIMTTTPWTVYKDLPTFMAIVKKNIEGGAISMQRIDEAVTRILAVKYAMGLIDKSDGKWKSAVRPPLPEFREVYPADGVSSIEDAAKSAALEAARKSLVLLKNTDDLLPIDPAQIKYVILTGERIIATQTSKTGKKQMLYTNYDNIGVQNGGWTLTWQGAEGNVLWSGENKKSSGAASLFDGISKIISKNGDTAQILRPQYAKIGDLDEVQAARSAFIEKLNSIPDMTAQNTVVVAAIAEHPYAEFMGDIDVPYCRNNDGDFESGCLYNLHFNWYAPYQQSSTLEIGFSEFDELVMLAVKNKAPEIPVITVLFSGRPMLIDSALEKSGAFLAAFLPGPTGGDAIADAIFGEYLFCDGMSVEDGITCRKNSANTLPVDWMRGMEQLKGFPDYDAGAPGIPRIPDPLFPSGYGLRTVRTSR